MSSSIPGPLRAWGLACLVGLAGCASAPPTVAISNAEIAIRKADAVGAAQHTPLELHVARKKLDSATQALEKGEIEVARRLAEQAQVDGELAEAPGDRVGTEDRYPVHDAPGTGLWTKRSNKRINCCALEH